MIRRFTIALLLFAGAAMGQSQPPREMILQDSIAVTGTGRVSIPPDRFTFTVGVQTFSAAVEDAVNENNRRTANVIAALKKAGAADREIRTSNFSIWPQQEHNPQGTSAPRIVGYQVMNNVTVTREKIADAGRLLQVAVSAGVNQASGLQFEVSDPARGRVEGLKAAFADARAKAQLLAEAAGRTLGAAIAIAEGTDIVPPRPFPRAAMMARAEAAVSDVPVEAGTQEMTYTVSVVFALR
ncbi:MAG TPA: SIMPL domain-containing protein [Thermoanaerobaculia bacterium]|nr:SIMPL domain-containing protein [Thermoanaerobaculia bacterium]